VETGRTNVDAIMARAPVDISTMSVEDILFWLMICIQDAYNTHIQKKAEDVQGAQTALDGATGASEQDRQQLQSSLDQETQALQRLLTKRDQFRHDVPADAEEVRRVGGEGLAVGSAGADDDVVQVDGVVVRGGVTPEAHVQGGRAAQRHEVDAGPPGCRTRCC
jgi:hypothetical protein